MNDTDAMDSATDTTPEEIEVGVRERRVVQTYLRQLATRSSKALRTAEDVAAALESVEKKLKISTDLDRLSLIQQREDLELEAYELRPDNSADVETQFISIASAYGASEGISYSSWREIGVPKEVLEAASIPRTRRRVPKKK